MPALPPPPAVVATRRDDAIDEQTEQHIPSSASSPTQSQLSLPLDPASSIASAIVPSHPQGNIVELRAPAPATTSFVAIPTTYHNLNDSPSPGVVVGIVLGSVGGTLVLLFLLYSALGFGPAVYPSRMEVSEGSVFSLRARDKHRRRRSSGVRTTEMYEVRTRERVVPDGATPVVVEARRSTTIPRSTSAAAPPRVVREESDSDDSEDEVVVIEEHTPPRRKSRRHSSRSRRSGERRDERRRSSTTYADGDGRYRDSRRYSRDR